MKRIYGAKTILLIIADIIAIIAAFMISIFFIYGHNSFFNISGLLLNTLKLAVPIYIIAFFVFNVYINLIAYSSVEYYVNIAVIVASCTVLLILADRLLKTPMLGGRAITLANLFVFIIVSLVRGSLRMLSVILSESYRTMRNKNVLIVGAGTAAKILIRDIRINPKLNYFIVGLVDDDHRKVKGIISGYKILGTSENIPSICSSKKVDIIIVAIPSAEDAAQQRILTICNKTGCETKILPSVDQILEDGRNILKQVKKVGIEDLLNRAPVVLDLVGIKHEFNDKIILISGGGGSIGSELCRQIVKYAPKKLVIVDNYENNAYELQMQLARQHPEIDVEVIIASIRDEVRLDKIFDTYRPDIVFHAAAHKHVPLMEISPSEAVKNNVYGTLNITKCADKYKVRKFVMISTDKAVNPTNIMGASKRICEMIIQSMDKNSIDTDFVAVRFGNVLGSNGSVIPLFQKQIESGGPVTITHEEITRYFMTIPEAAQLVIQACNLARGGEIFVLDMGQPVKIYDLAEKMIRLSGFVPNVDMEIKVVGLRPGEKLYEELLMSEEGLTNTAHQKIFIGKPSNFDFDTLMEKLKRLISICDSASELEIKREVAEIVSTYKIYG